MAGHWSLEGRRVVTSFFKFLLWRYDVTTYIACQQQIDLRNRDVELCFHVITFNHYRQKYGEIAREEICRWCFPRTHEEQQVCSFLSHILLLTMNNPNVRVPVWFQFFSHDLVLETKQKWQNIKILNCHIYRIAKLRKLNFVNPYDQRHPFTVMLIWLKWCVSYR